MISNTVTAIQQLSTGANVAYPFPNKIFAASDLIITAIDLTGVTYPFAFTSGATFQGPGVIATVSNVDVDTGCTVTLSAPLLANWTLDLRTNTPETQPTSIKNQGQFLPDLHEEAFDRITREVQDLKRLTYTYGIHGPDTESTPWPALPQPGLRVNMGLVFDGNGLPAIGVLPTVPVTSSFINSLLTQLGVGATLYPRTPAEIAAGVVPSAYAYPPGTLERYGANTVPGSTDMSAAITAANAVWVAGGPGILLSQGPYAVASAVTIAAPVTFQAPALLKPAPGITVTLNGAVTAPPVKIFDLSNAGALIAGSFGQVDFIDRWWGVVADGNYQTGTGTDNAPAFCAVLAAARARTNQVNMVANRIITLSGVYKCASQVTVGDGITWQGAGKYTTVIFAPTAFADLTGLIAINGNTGEPTNFRGFGILAQINGVAGNGIVSTKNGTFLSDLWVNGFYTGITISSTDNFVLDWVCEINFYGVNVTVTDVTLVDGETYGSQAAGILINNGASTANGRVRISSIRCTDDLQNGIVVSAGKNVSLHGIDFSTSKPTTMYVSAILINSSANVSITGCSGTCNFTAGGTRLGISIISSSLISVSGGVWTGFYDGIQASNSITLTITGGIYTSNGRHGVYLQSGGGCVVTGVNSWLNAGNGFTSNNATGYGTHVFVGNLAMQNTLNGFDLTVGGATAETQVQGNVARLNTGVSYAYTGPAAQFNEGAAPTNMT